MDSPQRHGDTEKFFCFSPCLCVSVVGLILTGCGRYADFSLPRQPGGDPHMTFTFEPRPQPVLPREREKDVLNPSVAGDTMYYSAFDGRTWRTARATSDDGLHWRKSGIVLSPDPHTWEGSYIAANGSAIQYRGGIWYWYVAGARNRPRIGLMRTRHPVLDPGPYMSWDERGVADPYIIRIEPYFYMYYLGQDRAGRQRIGLARSTDGIHWEKLRSNPILELSDEGFDENGLGEPAVWSSNGYYWMLYTGRDRSEMRRLGIARSTDGVHWTRLAAVYSGTEAWDSKVICDPTVEMAHGEVRVWFGGGDVARPDENLDGQIGYGVLRKVRQ